jgi:SAM-dependent methyltransferase
MNFARAGAEVTAVDLSVESIALATKRAEVFGLSNRINFYEANAERLSEFIEPGKYDLVYSFGVIHHSPYPEKIIAQIRNNFVEPGSTLKLMVYNRRSWKVFWMLGLEGMKYWKMDEIIAKHSEAQTGCPVTYSYSKETIKELIGDAFKIEDAFVDHIFPYQIPKYVKYEYEKEWYFRVLPNSAFRAVERKLGWHLCVTATAV